ncbi:unnamed protein product [Brassica rapa]|uniref:Uncharacterized protein n=1 Tax=Brassica campestris TaxID=3711 RepID=A0A8D9CU02_BRACM|nr:unnamed protein product [Brassica rapa]
MLICVLMDSQERPVCADRNTRTHKGSHGCPMCADRQPRTSYVCWRTPMDVLCVLNKQPTWAKIIQTVHGMGQRAEFKDQRADMCTDGQPRTSCVPRGPKSPEQSTGRASVLTMDVLCVLTNTHERPVCADGHPRMSCVHGHPVCADGQRRTHTDTHKQPQTSCVCWRTHTDVMCVLNRQPTWAKISQTVHGKGQRAESKDQNADMSTDGQPRTSVCADGHTRTHTDTHRQPWMSSTDVLCVLTDSHRRPVSTDIMCVLTDTDRQTRTHTDSHGRPVCADGQPRTGTDSHGYSPRRPKSSKQSAGRASVLSPRTNVLICVLMDSHGRPVCADGHTQTHTDSHGRPVCADGHTRTSCSMWAKITQTVHGKGQRAESKDQRADMSTDVMCVLTETHRHTRAATDVLSTYVMCVLTDSHRQPWTSCVCWRTPTDVLCVLNRQPTWAKITQTSTGRVSLLSPRTSVLICVLMDSHRRPLHGRPVCAGGQPQTHGQPRTSCVCWRTPTDVLSVLNREPTWAKITQIVHEKGQRAKSKDQRVDMYTVEQPRTSCVC